MILFNHFSSQFIPTNDGVIIGPFTLAVKSFFNFFTHDLHFIIDQ